MGNDTVIELLQDLDNNNVKLVLYKDRLRYSPRHVVDSNPFLKARLVRLKNVLISTLRSGDTINGDTIRGGEIGSDASGYSGDTIHVSGGGGDTITSTYIDRAHNSDMWSPESAVLIEWFIAEGQHRIPSEPFQLTPWQRVVDPKLFIKSILFDISWGPGGPRNMFGALGADLKRLKELFAGNAPRGEGTP
jgi:hypothetical protein